MHARRGTTRLIRSALLGAALSTSCWLGAALHGEPATALPRIQLAEQTDMLGLVDLCADQLQLRVEYDAKALRNLPVHLRMPQELTPTELWSVTNQLLAARGFAVVRIAEPDVLSVVPTAQAGERSMLQRSDAVGSQSGFMNVTVRLRHRHPKDIVEAVKQILSKPGGFATAIGDEGMILIGDFRSRVEHVLWLIDALDVPRPNVITERFEAARTSSTSLAAAVTAVVEARNSLGEPPVLGKIRAMAEESGLVVIAPEHEMTIWRDLIGQLDVRRTVETRSYAASAFTVEEVARLIEQAGRDPGPGGSGDRWKLVRDELTGTLLVTATPSEQQAIGQLIDRLNGLPPAARQPIRAFQIRHRNVREMMDVLSHLVQEGVLESGEAGRVDHASTDAAGAQQRSERDVLPRVPDMRSGDLAARERIPGIPVGGRDPSASEARMIRGAPTAPVGTTDGSPPGGQRASRSLSLTADEATNTLIAVGESRLLGQLEALIRTLDVRQPQVMLEAMVVSLNRSQALNLGVEIQKLEVSGSTLLSLSSMFGLGPIAPGLVNLPDAVGSGFTGAALNPGDFSVLVRALQTLNRGRSLSMPKVLVNNNQNATLNAVLQQPFTSTNASTTVATTSFGGTQDAGTTIQVKPQIAAGDELMLEYSVSLSSFVGASSAAGLPPPRQQNTVASVVRIPDSYTVVVGGLDLATEAEALSQIPLLGSVPVLGELFKNRSSNDSDSKFYVFIRATILRHDDYEDLKYISDPDVASAEINDGWPEVEPRLIQ